MNCDGTGHLGGNVSQLKAIHTWLRSIWLLWLANAWALNALYTTALSIRLRIDGH
jgi:hypothetical protein